MRRKIDNTIRLTLLNLAFIALCLVALIPILYAAKVSFSGSSGLFSGTFSLLPKNFTFDNYLKLLSKEPFLTWLKNSVLLSVFTVLTALTVAVPASYAFSRFRFKGRRTVLYLLLLLNAFPAILSMTALYRILNLTGLINKYSGLILIYSGTMAIFAIWNMKGYFDSIPVEIEEAAKVDGANDAQLIARIILPLARPAIIVTSVMVLIYVWNEYIFSVIFMISANGEKRTLAAGLYALQSTEYTRNWPLFSAASILVTLPVLFIFFKIQKYMVSGLTAGGVKR